MDTDRWSVVISSTERITMPKWKKYLASHWDRLMPENTRLLVFAGIHGLEDGRLGGQGGQEEGRLCGGLLVPAWCPAESQGCGDCREEDHDGRGGRWATSRHDVGRNENLGQLGEAARQFRPTVLVLAFC